MDVQQTTINAVRILSAEAIQKAKSGHPGLPMGSAPIGYTLFQNFLKFNPRDPRWDDRDRFILSAGHGSMLDYSLLYLYGYDLKKEDLMNFRQLGSRTPGHPEYGHTAGVETTTGPLGQGIANGVGMALAEAHLAAKYNKPGFPVVDHYTYVLCGDGCLEEGISYEACSFAGTHALGKLILIYDDNDITIEGDTDVTFKENVGARFAAQLAVVVAVYAAGCALASVLPIHLPGNIVGMVLLLVLLGTGLLKARHVGDACDCLLDNMSLFFIPAGVAILGCVSLLEGNAAKFALVCVVTTVLVFLATAYTVMLVSRLMAKRDARTADEEA